MRWHCQIFSYSNTCNRYDSISGTRKLRHRERGRASKEFQSSSYRAGAKFSTSDTQGLTLASWRPCPFCETLQVSLSPNLCRTGEACTGCEEDTLRAAGLDVGRYTYCSVKATPWRMGSAPSLPPSSRVAPLLPTVPSLPVGACSSHWRMSVHALSSQAPRPGAFHQPNREFFSPWGLGPPGPLLEAQCSH